MSAKQLNNKNAVKLTLPKYEVLGKAPEWFDDEHVAIWDELQGSIHPDLIGKSDRTTLEILVNLIHEYRQDPTKISSQKINLIVKYQTQLGLSPLARSRIKQAKDTPPKAEEKKNKFAGL